MMSSYIVTFQIININRIEFANIYLNFWFYSTVESIWFDWSEDSSSAWSLQRQNSDPQGQDDDDHDKLYEEFDENLRDNDNKEDFSKSLEFELDKIKVGSDSAISPLESVILNGIFLIT